VRLDEAIEAMHDVPQENVQSFLGQLSELTLDQQVTLSQLVGAVPEETESALKQALGAARRGNIIARVGYSNAAFLESRPSVWDESLEKGQFEIDGVLLEVEGQTWAVGGLTLQNVIYSREAPSVGTRVRIEGVIRDSKTYIIEVEQENEVKEQVKVEGSFDGTSHDGAVWYVGGIAITAPEDKTPPAPTANVQLQGTVQSGQLAVTQVESEKSEEGKVGLKGTLTGVDTNQKTIKIRAAGAQVSVNVSEGVIKTEEEQVLQLSQLASGVGRKVKVDGLHSREGRLYAGSVYVDLEHEESEMRAGEHD
jgi:hypothetical protein